MNSILHRLSQFTKYLGTSGKGIAKKYNEGVFGLVAGLITLGLEQLINEDVFHCPKSGYQKYAIAFFTVPAVLLLFLNVLTVPASGNIRVWTLCESCCVKAYRRYGDVISGCFSACAVGLVAPTVWVFLSLLNGRHFVCWELGYEFGDNITEKYLNDRGFDGMKVSNYEYKVHHAKAKSQLIGVVVIGVAVFCMAIFIIARRSCIKPYNAKKRLPGLWEFEKEEALAASGELRRVLDDHNEEEYFTEMACLVEHLVVIEQINALEDEKEELKNNENDEKKDEKVTEIQLEIKEFESLKYVIKSWNEHSKLVGMSKHETLSSVTKNCIEEAKLAYQGGSEKLIKERERRIEAAKSVLETYTESSRGKKELEEIIFQAWLIHRLLDQMRYFCVEKFMLWLNSSKSELKNLRIHFLAYVEDGFADSPQARGKIVASYIMQLYRRQNPFCRSAEQVIAKFKGIYPRAASSNPTDRYVNVNDYMYKHIMKPEVLEDCGDGPLTPGRAVPLTQPFMKDWTQIDEQQWRKSKQKKTKRSRLEKT